MYLGESILQENLCSLKNSMYAHWWDRVIAGRNMVNIVFAKSRTDSKQHMIKNLTFRLQHDLIKNTYLKNKFWLTSGN